MDILLGIIVGGLAGWLTGKAVDAEGSLTVARETYRLDLRYGMIGGVLGKYFLFWIVIGRGDAFTVCAMAAIGAVIAVGIARLLSLKSPLAYKSKHAP